MRFDILTLFPEMIRNTLSSSIVGRAEKKGIIDINAVDIRDYTLDKHRHTDDYPYGGGAGMVMSPEPIYRAYMSIKERAKDAPVIYMSPQGKPFTQKKAEEYAKLQGIVILCGHYEGVDERVIEEIVTEEVSVGDYVLTGGELGAMIVVDAVSRLIPGVLSKSESFENETFKDNLLEYPQYTRPPVFMGRAVPEVLLSGNHGFVDKWRREKSLERTLKKRPELLEGAKLSKEDEAYLKSLMEAEAHV